MIDIKTLRQLVRLMERNDLTELDLQDEQERVTLKRGGAQPVAPPPAPAAPPPAAVPPAAADAAPSAGPGAQPGGGEKAGAEDEGLVSITSPMVGTFYAAPNPDAEPFVQPGSKVDAETVVCVIEAMKVFNEIKAETSGTVERVLVENGQAVEFGQPLFQVRP